MNVLKTLRRPYLSLFLTSLILLISCNSIQERSLPENVSLKSISIDELKSAYSLMKIELDKNPELIKKIRESYNDKAKTNNNDFIDQETLDYLISISGLENIQISLDQVNLIIAENIEANNIGAEDYIKDYLDVSTSTKGYLDQLVIDDEFISNLEEQQDFLSLPIQEKDLLIKVNEVSYQRHLAKNRNVKNATDDFFNDGFYVGSSVGAAVGLVACGGVCGVIGWLVGGIIGSASK